jgi:hypothetical protein
MLNRRCVLIPTGETHHVLTGPAEGTNADADVASASREAMEVYFICYSVEVGRLMAAAMGRQKIE